MKSLFILMLILINQNASANVPDGFTIIEFRVPDGQVHSASGFYVDGKIFTAAHLFVHPETFDRTTLINIKVMQNGQYIDVATSNPNVHPKYLETAANGYDRIGSRNYDFAYLDAPNSLMSDYILPDFSDYNRTVGLFSEIYNGGEEFITSHGVVRILGKPTGTEQRLDGVSSTLLARELIFDERTQTLQAQQIHSDSASVQFLSTGHEIIKDGWSGGPISLKVPVTNKYVVIGLIKGKDFMPLREAYPGLPQEFNPFLNEAPLEINSIVGLNSWLNTIPKEMTSQGRDLSLSCQGFLSR